VETMRNCQPGGARIAADHVSSARHRRTGSRREPAVLLSLYDGRELRGAVVDRGGEWCTAAGAAGRPLGTFDSRQAAIDAIWQAAFEGCA
jgi:hypothetical protein